MADKGLAGLLEEWDAAIKDCYGSGDREDAIYGDSLRHAKQGQQYTRRTKWVILALAVTGLLIGIVADFNWSQRLRTVLLIRNKHFQDVGSVVRLPTDIGIINTTHQIETDFVFVNFVKPLVNVWSNSHREISISLRENYETSARCEFGSLTSLSLRILTSGMRTTEKWWPDHEVNRIVHLCRGRPPAIFNSKQNGSDSFWFRVSNLKTPLCWAYPRSLQCESIPHRFPLLFGIMHIGNGEADDSKSSQSSYGPMMGFQKDATTFDQLPNCYKKPHYILSVISFLAGIFVLLCGAGYWKAAAGAGVTEYGRGIGFFFLGSLCLVLCVWLIYQGFGLFEFKVAPCVA